MIQLGQQLPSSVAVEVTDALPSVNKVCDTLTKMVVSLRSEMRNKTVQDIINFGGGISCDGVKVEQTARKYYNFVSHIIERRFPFQEFKYRK